MEAVTIINKTESQPPFFNDYITAIPKNNQGKIKQTFNSYFKGLQSTIETEKEPKIKFLDLQLFHKCNKIKSIWYTKETWS